MKFLDHIILNPKITLNKGIKYPFIEMASVATNCREPALIETKEFTAGVKFEDYDTIVARIEPCLQNGKKFLAREIGRGFGSTEFLVFRPKDDFIDAVFLYYFMQTEYIRKRMIASMTGATGRQRVNNDIFKSIEINVPDISVQKGIARILTAYDDLIENNQKQIKLLEESARRLYKEWFVDLRFPGYEAAEVVDGIPKGWIQTTLGKIDCRLESGSRPKGGIDGSLKDGIPSVGAENVIGLGLYNYSSEKLITQEFFNNMKKGQIKDRDILIYKDGAYIGRTSLFQDGFPHAVTAVNEHVFLLHANDETLQYFLFFTLYQKEYFSKMQKLNKNSAQPGINQKNLTTLDVTLPSYVILEKFNEFVEPLMKSIFSKAKQNFHIAKGRDRLLPKLMNGEFEV